MRPPRHDAFKMLIVEIAWPPGDFRNMAGEIHHVLAGAAAGLDHVPGFPGKEALQHLPDGLMIAVKGRSIEAAVGLDRPAVLAEFNDIFCHDTLQITGGERFSALSRSRPPRQRP